MSDAAYVAELAEDVREIAESIVDTRTQEGKTLLRAADDLLRLHGQMQAGFARERELAALFAEAQK